MPPNALVSFSPKRAAGTDGMAGTPKTSVLARLGVIVSFGTRPAALLLVDALVLTLKAFDGFAGVHVENGLADGVPLATLKEKHGRGVS